jgi:hypothetical protein
MARGKLLGLGLALLLACAPAWASYTFDGTNDQLKGVLATQRADPLTLACWVKSTPDGTQDVFLQIGVGSSGNDTYSIRTSSAAQQYRVTSIDNAAGASQAQISGNYDATWVALVGVITSDSSRTAYLDEPNVTAVNNTATRTVANTLDDISIGEGLDDAGDVNGLIAECAIWVGVLESAEIQAYSEGTAAPFVADTEELIGYWPMATDTGGTVANQGSDTGGDLTASGNAAFNADHPTITGGSVPGFTVGLAKTADTADSITFSYTPSEDADAIWCGLYRRAATDPTGAEVEAGTNAHGTATEDPGDGSADSITITTDDTDPRAAYDAHCFLENENGYSSISSVDKATTEAPVGYEYFEVSGYSQTPGEFSVFDDSDPVVADDDWAQVSSNADCFIHGAAAHPFIWDAAGGGVVNAGAGHPTTLMIVYRRIQHLSLEGWGDAAPVPFALNNLPPSFISLDSETHPNGWLFAEDESDSVPLDIVWSHPYNRPLTHNGTNLPAGMSEDGEDLDASPTTCDVYTDPNLEATDDLGLSADTDVTITVAPRIPDMSDMTESEAEAAIAALCD